MRFMQNLSLSHPLQWRIKHLKKRLTNYRKSHLFVVVVNQQSSAPWQPQAPGQDSRNFCLVGTSGGPRAISMNIRAVKRKTSRFTRQKPEPDVRTSLHACPRYQGSPPVQTYPPSQPLSARHQPCEWHTLLRTDRHSTICA